MADGNRRPYFIARTGREQEREAAAALSEALGGLPLAHEQAAAYCERLEMSLTEYHKRFEATPARLLDSERDAPPEYHDRLTVAKTFGLAIDEAAQLHPAAEPLIVHAALLAPEPIPLFLFSEAREKFGEPLASMLADDGLDEAVAALRIFRLVDRETISDERDPTMTTDCLRLHPLVREVARSRCEGAVANDILSDLLASLMAVYPNDVFDDPKCWIRARQLDVLAVTLTDDACGIRGAELQLAYLLDRLATYRAGALAAYPQAQELFERALAIRERVFGLEHSDSLATLNNLGMLLRLSGKLADARSHLERALEIRKRVFGLQHLDTATVLNNLALVLES